MAANPSGQGFQNKNRVAILAELDKEKRKLLMQNQSSTNHPGARISNEQCDSEGRESLNSQVTKIPILALRSQDPLLTRTSGTTLSSSTLQPSRRRLCSMHMHIHLDTS
ncbi:SOSS complex subunit C isoform 1-T1 [Megaptera novaeangliae]